MQTIRKCPKIWMGVGGWSVRDVAQGYCAVTKVLLVLTCLIFGLQPACSSEKQILDTKNHVIAVCLSADGNMLCLVTRDGEEQALNINDLRGPVVARIIAKASSISDVQFIGYQKLIYVCNNRDIMVYDKPTNQTKLLTSGAHPRFSEVSRALLFMRDDHLWIRRLVDEAREQSLSNTTHFVICDWLNGSEGVACKDGSVWKIGLDGKNDMLLQGEHYSPCYFDALLSPEADLLLLRSDDTKANVNLGAQSIWLMKMGSKNAKQMAKGSMARWLDNARLVFTADGKLMTLNVLNRNVEIVYDGGNMEAFAAGNGKVVYAVSIIDEDGLYSGSSVFLITPPKDKP